MFKLADEHLEVAQEIAQKHRRKKHCDHCYDRGWIGINEQNLLVLCPHCVDREAALEEWKTYISEHEDLKEHFSELFEEKPVEEEETESTIPVAHTKKPAQPQVKKTFVPGQKKFGRTKKIG